MPTTYERADESVIDQMNQMIDKYHSDLKENGVTIDVLMAANADGDAVTLGGYPCEAKVKIVSLKDRVKGCADVEIIIDSATWVDLTVDQQLALLDHELEHIELQPDGMLPTGQFVFKTDDLGRPKLKCRKHDWQMGWFNVIASRHFAASPEQRQAKRLFEECGLLFFGKIASSGGAVDVEITRTEAAPA